MFMFSFCNPILLVGVRATKLVKYAIGRTEILKGSIYIATPTVCSDDFEFMILLRPKSVI
jgi:hypothetical protein